jgi:hypothetical protein
LLSRQQLSVAGASQRRETHEAAATAGEQPKTSDSTRREQDVDALLAWDGWPAFKLRFEFRPFAIDVHGEEWPSTKKIVLQLAKHHSKASAMTTAHASV